MMILYYDDIIVYDTYDSYTVNNLMILMDGERKTKKQNWGAPPCATTACVFSRSELPKVVRIPSVFNILTSKCASRHNGVQFFEI